MIDTNWQMLHSFTWIYPSNAFQFSSWSPRSPSCPWTCLHHHRHPHQTRQSPLSSLAGFACQRSRLCRQQRFLATCRTREQIHASSLTCEIVQSPRPPRHRRPRRFGRMTVALYYQYQPSYQHAGRCPASLFAPAAFGSPRRLCPRRSARLTVGVVPQNQLYCHREGHSSSPEYRHTLGAARWSFARPFPCRWRDCFRWCPGHRGAPCSTSRRTQLLWRSSRCSPWSWWFSRRFAFIRFPFRWAHS